MRDTLCGVEEPAWAGDCVAGLGASTGATDSEALSRRGVLRGRLDG